MVDRVRVDVEGDTLLDCVSQLDTAFALIYANARPIWSSPTMHMTFTSPPGVEVAGGAGGWMVANSPTISSASARTVVPYESEFIEEVFETFVTDMGAIRYSGRRIMKFIETEADTVPPVSGEHGFVVKVKEGTPKLGTSIDIQCFGHPEANAYGVVYESVLAAGIEPDEWWELTQDGEEIPPLRKVRDLTAGEIVFDGVNDEREEEED